MSDTYVSIPGVYLPEHSFSNDDVINMVRQNYTGANDGWKSVESAIKRIFDICNTQVRYLDFNPESRVAEYAANAARDCIKRTDTNLDEIDLIIYCGIAREYFEPATAMEVASNLGIESVHAFDITTACVGQMEGIRAANAYLNMYPDYRRALVCTAELSREFLSFDIQSVKDLYTKSAGLTIGNGASCFMVSKTPWEKGCMRILGTKSFSAPKHWKICQVPINGSFQSSSIALMKLHIMIAPHLVEFMGSLNWNASEVDHILFHQPSESMTKKVIEKFGGNADKGIYTHHLYGNNASATVGIVFDQLLKERDLIPGDKILMGSAAAGFTVTAVAGEWTRVA